MFYNNNYTNESYQNYSNNYEYHQGSQCQVNYPGVESNLYQEDINKCLSYVNSDYNSYDASVNYDSSYFDTPQDCNRDCSIKDSGISTDLDENSTNIVEKKTVHTHRSKVEEEDCQLCREATTYLLSTPFINYLDHKFIPSNSKKVSLSSDEINYVEYKLLSNFEFATSKKVMQKDLFNGYFIHPSMFIEHNLHSIRAEFEFNGRTVDNLERKMLRDEENQRLYPKTQNFDYKNELYSFQPSANSTPSKYLSNQQQQYCQNQRMQNNTVSWKKPVVLDPRLSARYDAVFPSLEVSLNNCIYDKQSTCINAMDNNFYYCVFCKNNKEPTKDYMTHILRDFTGRVCCPKLRKYICPICGATADNAHTIKYCPQNKTIMPRISTM